MGQRKTNEKVNRKINKNVFFDISSASGVCGRGQGVGGKGTEPDVMCSRKAAVLKWSGRGNFRRTSEALRLRQKERGSNKKK